MGSQTTMELIKTLAIKNDFHYHKDRTQKVESIKLTRSEEVRVLQNTAKKAQIKGYLLLSGRILTHE